MYQVHNQKFDRAAPAGPLTTLFIRDSGYALGVSETRKHLWGEARAGAFVPFVCDRDHVVVFIPEDVRGPGFAMASRRAEWVSRVLKGIGGVAETGNPDWVTARWDGLNLSCPTPDAGCPSMEFKFPMGGASPGCSPFLAARPGLGAIPWGASHVVYTRGTSTLVRITEKQGYSMRVSTSRKAANAAYRVFRDGSAEGASMAACFSREYATESARTPVYDMPGDDLSALNSDEVVFAAGRLHGATYGAARDMTVRTLAEGLSSYYQSQCVKFEPETSAPHALLAMDALFARGMLSANDGAMEAFFHARG